MYMSVFRVFWVAGLFSFCATAPGEVYTLSLHDALPISCRPSAPSTSPAPRRSSRTSSPQRSTWTRDRKSTRLNSSHRTTSYAVFCLKKKKDADVFVFEQDLVVLGRGDHCVQLRGISHGD